MVRSCSRAAQGTSHAPSLTIREIRAVRLRDGFNSRFVRVYTDQGLTGTGEMLDTVGAEYIVNHNIGPSLAGRDPSRSKEFYSTYGAGSIFPPGVPPRPSSCGEWADHTLPPSAEWKWRCGIWRARR